MTLAPLCLGMAVATRLIAFGWDRKPLFLTQALALLAFCALLRQPFLRDGIDPAAEELAGLANLTSTLSLVLGIVCASHFAGLAERLNHATEFATTRRYLTTLAVAAVACLYLAGDASEIRVADPTSLGDFATRVLTHIHVSSVVLSAAVVLVTAVRIRRSPNARASLRRSAFLLAAGAVCAIAYGLLIEVYPLIDRDGDGRPFGSAIDYDQALRILTEPMCLALAAAGVSGARRPYRWSIPRSRLIELIRIR